MATRRQLLFSGAAVAAFVASFQVLPRILSGRQGFDFIPVNGVPGFRTIAAGTSSATGLDFLVGLDRPTPAPSDMMTSIKANPAEALFFNDSGQSTKTPLAYFFDFYCPSCRILSGHISRLVAESEVTLSRHHWPIFGETSELAARAALAAEMQGQGAAFYDRLISMPVRVTPAYIRELVTGMGLSWTDIERDMQSSPVSTALDRSRAIAQLFGFIGTPALVVGKTVVQGEIPLPRLRSLVQLEAQERTVLSVNR